MVNTLYQWDLSIFFWINHGWSCPLLDGFFSFITDFHHFYFPVALLFIYWLWKGGAKSRWLVLSLGVAILLSDQSSSHLFKAWVERVRPCNALEGVLTPVGKSGAYSFPSSHAANMGASMFLLSVYFRRWTWAFAAIALLVGLSRIYLGLHYPSDVLGGYALGVLIGFLVWRGVEKLRGSRQNKPGKRMGRKIKKDNFTPHPTLSRNRTSPRLRPTSGRGR